MDGILVVGLCQQGTEPCMQSNPIYTNHTSADNCQVDLLLPAGCFEILHRKLVQERLPPIFSRVILRLADMLDGSFFTDYIKNGEFLLSCWCTIAQHR